MSLESVGARVEAIQARMALLMGGVAPAAVTTSGTGAAPVDFDQALSRSTSRLDGGAGGRVLALARAELARGVAEINGNNDSPDIARYRSATTGAVAGAPWCAYFVSYLARESGVPLGDRGQGFGAVDDVAAWAQRTGRWIPAGGSARPGDLIVFDEHIGVVEAVNPDGSYTTIEGNHSDRVDRVRRGHDEPLGFVRL